MSINQIVCLLALCGFMSGCNHWPANGRGGVAEHVSSPPGCGEWRSTEDHRHLDHRLACENQRLVTLQRLGAHLHQPALTEQARRQSQRAWRAITGGLLSDADIDLMIYGALLDELERRLVLHNQGVVPEVAGDETASRVVGHTPPFGHVLFATGSDRINPAALEWLQTLSSFSPSLTAGSIQLIGYADDRGDEQLNLALSARRADSVKRVLIEAGVTPASILTQGRGEQTPRYVNRDRDARLANRRVDIHWEQAREAETVMISNSHPPN